MSEKGKLNRKIEDLTEGLEQQQKDKIYRSLFKIVDAMCEMKSSGVPIIPNPPKPKTCPNCGTTIT